MWLQTNFFVQNKSDTNNNNNDNNNNNNNDEIYLLNLPRES